MKSLRDAAERHARRKNVAGGERSWGLRDDEVARRAVKRLAGGMQVDCGRSSAPPSARVGRCSAL
jgi:hypothetical protein